MDWFDLLHLLRYACGSHASHGSSNGGGLFGRLLLQSNSSSESPWMGRRLLQANLTSESPWMFLLLTFISVIVLFLLMKIVVVPLMKRVCEKYLFGAAGRTLTRQPSGVFKVYRRDLAAKKPRKQVTIIRGGGTEKNCSNMAKRHGRMRHPRCWVRRVRVFFRNSAPLQPATGEVIEPCWKIYKKTECGTSHVTVQVASELGQRRITISWVDGFDEFAIPHENSNLPDCYFRDSTGDRPNFHVPVVLEKDASGKYRGFSNTHKSLQGANVAFNNGRQVRLQDSDWHAA